MVDGESLANVGILGTGLICIVYCWRQCRVLQRLKLDGRKYLEDNESDEALLMHMSGCIDRIETLGAVIAEGAVSFVMAEFRYMSVFVVAFTLITGIAVGPVTACSFFVGCVSSATASFVGIKVATYANYRVTHECWRGVSHGFALAIQAGSVAAASLVTIAVLSLYALAWTFNMECFQKYENFSPWTDLAGYSFGVSSIGLFMRVGGGIYTKAADIGADLSGKSDYALCEDDYRNPACIADHVGDNVGGVVGIGADLFSSFAAATVAAWYISAESGHDCNGKDLGIRHDWKIMMFPMLITCSGLLVNLLAVNVVGTFCKVHEVKDVEMVLKKFLIVAVLSETPVLYALAWTCLPTSFVISCHYTEVTPMQCSLCVWLGLWSGAFMAYVTEYYTSHRRYPVRQIAEAQEVSAATGIIFGLAVGYRSCAAPVFCLATTTLLAHTLVGPYGIALAALGMLTVMTMCLTIDAYDSIADNATGIAEMSGLTTDESGDITDVLGGAGAIGNGFAIGVGALVSISLLNAFSLRAGLKDVNAMDRWHFTGLLLGAMLPYAFSAITMTSVGKAANEIVAECQRQFPGIIYNDVKPNYDRCITIATSASLQKLGEAGLIVIGSPIIIGFCLGKKCTAGLLQGSLVSGMQMGVSMINTGGAWDNAKKYVVDKGVKGSEQHKNAVIGDTVGDPLKDVSGPSLNVLVNLCAITCFVFGNWIRNWSGPAGGPFWMDESWS